MDLLAVLKKGNLGMIQISQIPGNIDLVMVTLLLEL
jgi:hypothetical protein